MQPTSPQQWSEYLESIARPVLETTPLLKNAGHSPQSLLRFIDTFTDERGDRRAVDRPMLARLLGVHPGPTPTLGEADTDLRLWWALHDGSPIDACAADPPGPILGVDAFSTGAVETTTETELAALHALWHHGDRDPRRRDRCLDAARWHIDMLQPDNATNHPWAVHVFVHLAEITRDPDVSATARIHAETLVHNSIVSTGQPDVFSACLLLDATRTLGG